MSPSDNLKDTSIRIVNDSRYHKQVSTKKVPGIPQQFEEDCQALLMTVHHKLTYFQKVDIDLDLPRGILKMQVKDEAIKKVHPKITYYQKVDTDLDVPKSILKTHVESTFVMHAQSKKAQPENKIAIPDALLDKRKSTLHVCFGYIEIREYEQIVCDN
jgi:hypothetical protein